MTACLFGTYDSAHSANRLLRRALVGAGFDVEELHAPLWQDTHSKGRRYFGVASLTGLAGRWAAATRQLAAAWRRRQGPPPLVVSGVGGPLDALIGARVRRAPARHRFR